MGSCEPKDALFLKAVAVLVAVLVLIVMVTSCFCLVRLRLICHRAKRSRKRGRKRRPKKTNCEYPCEGCQIKAINYQRINSSLTIQSIFSAHDTKEGLLTSKSSLIHDETLASAMQAKRTMHGLNPSELGSSQQPSSLFLDLDKVILEQSEDSSTQDCRTSTTPSAVSSPKI